MTVTVLITETGERFTGKFAVVEPDHIACFTGIMADKKGGFRGCGRKRVFSSSAVSISADDPRVEIKRIQEGAG